MAELSPAAQAIHQAVDAVFALSTTEPTTENVAAAVLRAAAYQVAPVDSDGPWMWTDRDEMRSEILAIADELEAGHG